MKETTKAHFEAFKKTFLEYQKILNVQDYSVVFRHEDFDDPDTYADIFWSVECKHATVRFNKVLDENKYVDLEPEKSGKHEALHLAFARAEYLAGSRFITSNEIDRTFEGLVRLFEEIL